MFWKVTTLFNSVLLVSYLPRHTHILSVSDAADSGPPTQRAEAPFSTYLVVL